MKQEKHQSSYYATIAYALLNAHTVIKCYSMNNYGTQIEKAENPDIYQELHQNVVANAVAPMDQKRHGMKNV